MIEQGVPEVKLHLRLVQITVYPSMMRDAASPKTTLCGSAATTGMTSAMSLKIRGIPESEHHLHHDGTYQRTSPQWGKVDSMLWRDHSDRSDGQTSSRLETMIGMTDPAILKNLFRFIRPSSRPLEEMIG
jgi:hypothetical protein